MVAHPEPSEKPPEDDASRSTSLRWHPRITPFRLAFIFSTAALGIAKAVTVSQNETIASTTVEWVAGVVLALVFQLLAPLESSERHNPLSQFIFCQDCLAPLWKVLPRPAYADDERPIPRYRAPFNDFAEIQKYYQELTPVVTPYRVLVSVVTAGFGVVKMGCAYAGLDATMNAVDWSYSIPIILVLYYGGLYENNTADLARGFFASDCSNGIILVIVPVIYFFLLSGASLFVPYWFKFWYDTAMDTINSPLMMIDTTLANDPIPQWVHYTHDQSLVILAATAMTVCAIFGLLPLMAVMLYFAELEFKVARWISAHVGGLIPRNTLVNNPPLQVESAGSNAQSYASSIVTKLLVVFLYTVALFLCIVLGIFALGLGVRLYPSLYLRTDAVVLKVLDAVMGIAFGACAYAPFKGAWVVFKELVKYIRTSMRSAGKVIP